MIRRIREQETEGHGSKPMTRERRTFGPLTYVTLAIAIVAVPIGISFQIAERVSMSQAEPGAPVDPDARVASLIAMLEKGDDTARAGAIASLGDFHLMYGYDPKATKARARASVALIGLLKSVDAAERASAAETLGKIAPDDPSVISGLTALLRDNDPTVRFFAASGLLRFERDADARSRALRALSEMAEDELCADRRAVLAVLWNSGEPGQDVVLKTLLRLLSSKEPLDRKEGIRSAASLQIGIDRLLRALAPLLTSDKAEVRWAAAVAVMDASGPEEKAPDPSIISALERAVIDTSLSLDQRVTSIDALTQPGSGMAGLMAMGGGMAGVSGTGPPWAWPPLHRCGLELARQLAHKDLNVRIAAATLLHMIEADTLAGKNLPGENEADSISDL